MPQYEKPRLTLPVQPKGALPGPGGSPFEQGRTRLSLSVPNRPGRSAGYPAIGEWIGAGTAVQVGRLFPRARPGSPQAALVEDRSRDRGSLRSRRRAPPSCGSGAQPVVRSGPGGCRTVDHRGIDRPSRRRRQLPIQGPGRSEVGLRDPDSGGDASLLQSAPDGPGRRGQRVLQQRLPEAGTAVSVLQQDGGGEDAPHLRVGRRVHAAGTRHHFPPG